MHHAYVGKLLRLTLLAPDIIEAVLDGRLPKGVKLEDLVRPLPADWEGQRRVLQASTAGDDHPFWAIIDRPNVIVTPHVAWASEEAMQTLWDQLIDTIERFHRGEPANVVT